MKILAQHLALIIVVGLFSAQLIAADGVVIRKKGEISPNLTPTQLNAIPELRNPLRAPDTSRISADEGDVYDGIPGVMTRDGIVEDFEAADFRAYGSFGIPYTTTRVQDGSTSASGTTNSNRLSTTYPYRTIGKLTLRTPTGGSGHCSASVIRQGIIVTAAHCIQRFGSGNSINSQFQFRPGHYGATGATASQIAPYGTWDWVALIRPVSWINGTDKGSGSARDNDLALIALGKVGGKFVGQRTGQLGYGWNNYSFVSSSKTGSKLTAAVSTLGYPGLMDLGRIMQRTDGPTYTTTISNAGQLWQGSNLTGGSSGGPWVVNFRSVTPSLSGGAQPGTASNMAVVGVTSWGSSDPNAPKDNYSSQFRQNSAYPNSNYGVYGAGNIGYLLNTLCNLKIGGVTLASQGYCN